MRYATGSCEHCAASFGVEIFHNGFGDSSYAYCGGCGMRPSSQAGAIVGRTASSAMQAEVSPDMEYLMPWTCGSKFSTENTPHCPNCKQPLSAEAAAQHRAAKSWNQKRMAMAARLGTDSIAQ